MLASGSILSLICLRQNNRRIKSSPRWTPPKKTITVRPDQQTPLTWRILFSVSLLRIRQPDPPKSSGPMDGRLDWNKIKVIIVHPPPTQPPRCHRSRLWQSRLNPLLLRPPLLLPPSAQPHHDGWVRERVQYRNQPSDRVCRVD